MLDELEEDRRQGQDHPDALHKQLQASRQDWKVHLGYFGHLIPILSLLSPSLTVVVTIGILSSQSAYATTEAQKTPRAAPAKFSIWIRFTLFDDQIFSNCQIGTPLRSCHANFRRFRQYFRVTAFREM